jgi:hypothetical protein
VARTALTIVSRVLRWSWPEADGHPRASRVAGTAISGRRRVRHRAPNFCRCWARRQRVHLRPSWRISRLCRSPGKPARRGRSPCQARTASAHVADGTVHLRFVLAPASIAVVPRRVQAIRFYRREEPECPIRRSDS